MNFKDMNIEDIINWCKENHQTKWLKNIASQQVPYRVYPRVKGEDGKYHVDKTQEPKIVYRPISFIQIKMEFVQTFMPEIAPKPKEKKPTMYDIINAL